MADLSDAAHAEAMRNACWDPKPLRRNESPDDYPMERLPGIIGQAVREVVAWVQAPVALVAASALSVVSAAVQTQFSVSRNSRMHGPASLFLLTVAESGERKTTVDNLFKKAITEWEAKQRAEAKKLKKEYEEAKEAWEKADKENKGEKPLPPPPTPSMLRGDDTSEALLMHLDKYPIAAIITAEAGIIFGSHAMKPENLQRNLGQANALWDGGPIIEGRITRGEINLQSARVTMGLMLQPKVLKNFTGQSSGMARGIGYLARFLFCNPPSTQGTRFYFDPPPMPALDRFQERVAQLLNYHAVLDEVGNLVTLHVQLDEGAREAWIAFHDEVEEYLGGDREYSGIRDVASKAAENAARIACCLHIFTSPTATHINRIMMDAACSLMRWYLDEAVRFGREAEATEEVRNAELLEEWLVQKCKEAKWAKREFEMTVNTIRQKGPNALRGRKRVDDALELLRDHGRIRLVKFQGSKTQYVRVAPQVIAEYD